ncbi:MAG: hypothetical protein ACP5N1_03810 [Candidatus Woesearchaeota archaeon]
MHKTFQQIKTASLKDVIGIELDFKEISVKAGHTLDPRDANTHKYIDPKDYYSHELSYFTEKTADYLLEHMFDNLEHIFKNKVVVDLGSSYTPFAYLTALKSGARAYIGVDFNNRIGLLTSNISHLLFNRDIVDEQIPLVPLHLEMLSFLNASVCSNQKYSFICSSYGTYPTDTGLFSVKFFDILRNLLSKATDSEGGILTISTDLQMPEFYTLEKDRCYEISFLKLK